MMVVSDLFGYFASHSNPNENDVPSESINVCVSRVVFFRPWRNVNKRMSMLCRAWRAAVDIGLNTILNGVLSYRFIGRYLMESVIH